jgi:uncharacterized protein (TIGR02444 family)
MTQSESMTGSPFWRFSLRFYRRPAVAEACLTLQDEAGVDVNMLLFLLWCATQGRRLSATEVGELSRDCEAWARSAVIPLRALRRGLKAPPPLIADGEVEVFRSKIKAVELEAERLQQAATHAVGEARRGGPLADGGGFCQYRRVSNDQDGKAVSRTGGEDRAGGARRGVCKERRLKPKWRKARRWWRKIS